MQNLNLLELVNQGWLATYPLILFSVVMVAVLLERLFAFRGIISTTNTVTNLIVPQLAKGDFNSALSVSNKYTKNIQAKTYSSLLSARDEKSLREVSDRLEEKRFEEVHHLKQNIWILGTIGSSAPFIGLLGTVVGIIKSFHTMSVAGTGGFSVVAGGISEALVATAAGLVVAIVAVMSYNYLQTKVAIINTVLKINSTKFFEAYKEGRKNNGNREIRRKVG